MSSNCGYKQNWKQVSRTTPPVNVVVNTKIEDEKGCRHEGHLKFSKGLWWIPDGSMYVYYTPTHWSEV